MYKFIFKSKHALQSFSTINSFRKSVAQHAKKFSNNHKHSFDLSGIIPPIVTPFNIDESIAYDKLKLNFEKWNKIPFRGMLNI